MIQVQFLYNRGFGVRLGIRVGAVNIQVAAHTRGVTSVVGIGIETECRRAVVIGYLGRHHHIQCKFPVGNLTVTYKQAPSLPVECNCLPVFSVTPCCNTHLGIIEGGRNHAVESRCKIPCGICNPAFDNGLLTGHKLHRLFVTADWRDRAVAYCGQFYLLRRHHGAECRVTQKDIA